MSISCWEFAYRQDLDTVLMAHEQRSSLDTVLSSQGRKQPTPAAFSPLALESLRGSRLQHWQGRLMVTARVSTERSVHGSGRVGESEHTLNEHPSVYNVQSRLNMYNTSFSALFTFPPSLPFPCCSNRGAERSMWSTLSFAPLAFRNVALASASDLLRVLGGTVRRKRAEGFNMYHIQRSAVT